MNRLSSFARLLLLFSLAIIIILFFYMGIYLPKEEKLTALIDETSILEKNISSLKAKQKELSQEMIPQMDLPSIPAELLKGSALTDDMATLLSQWTKEGKKMGIEFLLFKPLEEKAWGPVVEMPIAITLRGTFHQTLGFFDTLSKDERKILISNINMSKPEKKEATYVISTYAIATTFRKGAP